MSEVFNECERCGERGTRDHFEHIREDEISLVYECWNCNVTWAVSWTNANKGSPMEF